MALIPQETHWRVKAYVAKAHPRGGTTGWQDYTDANVAFRANSLPEGRRNSDFAAAVDIALGQLCEHLIGTTGYVLFVSGENARNLWPQLANKNIECGHDHTELFEGRPMLPGIGLAVSNQPHAVIRVTSGSADIPRPVHMSRPKTIGGGTVVDDITKTTRALYQLDNSNNTWLLSNVPRQFDGGKIHSRAGSTYTRWSAKGAAQRKTWFAHTATEIFVAHCDSDPLRYAVLAPRLCHHALSWEGRTSYPAPVHLAIQMDKDHPEYRRTVDATDEIDPEDPAEISDLPTDVG